MKKTVDIYLKQVYPFIIQPYTDDVFTGYRGFYPDIPAIEAYGATQIEVLEELEGVKEEWMHFAFNKGIHIPEPYEHYPKEENQNKAIITYGTGGVINHDI